MKTRHAVIVTLALVLPAAHAFATTDTWDGGSAVDSNLSTGANWADNTAPLSDLVNTDIVFAGTVRLTPNVSVAFSTNSVVFNNTAGANAFTIGGTTLSVGAGGITNNDADTNSFTNTLNFTGVANATINAASGGLTFTNSIALPTGTLTVDGASATNFNNFSGSTSLTKQGVGTMTWSPTAASNSMDVTVSTGTLTMEADGSTDVFNSSASLAVNGTSVLNINESMTLSGAALTRASGATMTLAAGKMLTVQSAGGVAITGSFLNTTASTIAVTGAGSTFTTTSSLTINGGSAMNVTSGGAVSSGTGAVSIGTSGNGTATVDGSGSSFGGGGLNVGLSGSTGSLTLSNGGSGTFSTITVDNSGVIGTSGTLNVQSGASVSGSSLTVATSAAANTGTVTITDAGSALTLTGAATATIGASSASTGHLNVLDGGTFTSGTGTITVNATGTVNILDGTFNANGNMTVNGFLTRSSPTGNFFLAAGKTLTVQNSGDVFIAGAFSNQTASTIVVTGGGSTFDITSTLSINGGSTFNVSLGGAVSCGTSAINVGASGNGTVTVDGSGSSFGGGSVAIGGSGNTGSLTFSHSAFGTFSSGISVDSSAIGGTSGTLNIQSGATVSGAFLALANSAAANSGTVTITDAGSALTLTGGNTTTIGSASASTANLNVQSGGTFTSGIGTLAVNPTGKVLIVGTFNANGNLDINGGQLGRGNSGTLTLATGKTMTVRSGGLGNFTGDLNLLNANCGLTVTGTGSTFVVTGTLLTSNSFDLNVTSSGSVSVASLIIGEGASADLISVTGTESTFAAALNSNFGNATVTFDGGSTGSFAGLLVDPDQLGLPGVTATFLVRGGASVTGGQTTIGATGNPGTSNASIFTVTGAGSSYSQTSTLQIGSSNIGAGIGTGTLNVASDGVYTSGTGTIFLEKTGSINIDGGTLHLAGPLARNGGVLNFNTGALSIIDNLTVGVGGLLGADVTFDATRQFTTSATTTIDALHALTLNGGTFSTGALAVNGTLAFNSGTLAVTGAVGLAVGGGGPLGSAITLGAGKTLNVTNTATLSSGSILSIDAGAKYSAGITNNSGTVALNGATAIVAGTTFNNVGLLRGEGLVTAAFNNQTTGEVRAETGKSLKFSGGGSANEGRINLLGGTVEFVQPYTNSFIGQILGTGTIIVGGTGLTNEGQLIFSSGIGYVFGDVNNNSGSAGRGITISGNSNVTFWDDVTHQTGPLFKVQTGSSATFFGTFGGGGSITGGGDVYFEADLTPGSSPASVAYTANVHLDPTSQLKIELGGTTPGTQFDQVHVTGQLALTGALNVSLINSFTPVIGNSFDILDWTTLSGAFSFIQLPTLSGAAWDTSQLYTSGTLFVLPNRGDINRDSHVDVADISALGSALSDLDKYKSTSSLTDPQLLNLVANVNGDNQVDNADVQALLIYLANNAGALPAPGGGSSIAAVPEPPSLILLALALPGLAFRARRNRLGAR